MEHRDRNAGWRRRSGRAAWWRGPRAIRAALAGGMSVRKTAAKFDVNPSTVQRVAHPFEGADNASVAGAA
jgi:hypothetical protein